MPKYELHYFDGPGRAELTRVIFAASGVDFDDVRLTQADWATEKDSTPWGSLPILKVDGKITIGQSKAVARFAARETGIAGRTSWEQAMADSVVDTMVELHDAAISIFLEKDEKIKGEKKEVLSTKTLPTTLENLSKFHEGNDGGSGWFVGKNMTWADLSFFVVFKGFMDNVNKDVLKSHPKLDALHQRVASQPKIAAYLNKSKK